jgi:hypothetical protein
MHALKRILRLRRTGAYSDRHRLIGSANSYLTYAKEYRRIKYYSDSAYCYGYSNGYLYAALDEELRSESQLPLFFYFDREIETANKYRRMLSKLPLLHKSAFRYAEKLAAKRPDLKTHILDHKDQLDLSKIRPFANLK